MGRARAKTSAVAKALLSVEEAAVLLGVDRATCYRAIRRQTFPLPVVRLGGRIRIPRRAVERLLDGADPAKDANQTQLASDRCPTCGSPSTPSSPPSSRRPTCSAARRSSSATTSV